LAEEVLRMPTQSPLNNWLTQLAEKKWLYYGSRSVYCNAGHDILALPFINICGWTDAYRWKWKVSCRCCSRKI